MASAVMSNFWGFCKEAPDGSFYFNAMLYNRDMSWAGLPQVSVPRGVPVLDVNDAVLVYDNRRSMP